jgi:hypothetical protein
VLPLHECVVETLHAAVEATIDPVVAESTTETLHSAVDPATTGAAPTETFCLCFWV